MSRWAKLAWFCVGWLAAVVVIVVLLSAFDKNDPVDRRIRQAEMYRSRSCIVTRVTIFENGNREQFYVIEGGTEHGRLQPPKCTIEVIR